MKYYRQLLLTLCVILLTSLSAFAQTYYEFSYKNPDGKQCYGFLIYDDDAHVTMRIVEADNNNNITAAEDLHYSVMQGSEDEQKYTAFAPTKSHPNAPYIVFLHSKQENEEGVPAICFDLEKEDFTDPDSFTEVGLTDITTEYLQQFYDVEDSTYKAIMAAKNKVLSERAIIKKSFDDGFDTYNAVWDMMDDDDTSNSNNSSNSDASNSGASNSDNDDSDNYDSGNYDSDDDSGDTYNNPSSSDPSNGGSATSTPNTPSTPSTPSVPNTPSTPNTPSVPSTPTTPNTPSTPSTPNTPNTPSTSPSDAPKVTLHLVLVLDIKDEKIGSYTQKNYEMVSSQMKEIAETLGIRLKEYKVAGPNYFCDTLDRVLDDLKPDPNDVVFFLYDGHGIPRNETEVQKEPFPSMAIMSSSKKYAKIFNMHKIYERICATKARLNIVLSEACNVTGKELEQNWQARGFHSRATNNYSVSHLGKLFLQARGNMIGTSSLPHQFSYAGIFIKAFVHALAKEAHAIKQQPPSWNSLFDYAKVLTVENAKLIQRHQEPFNESTIR